MGYTNAAAARRRGAAATLSEEDTFRKASKACGHKGGVSTAARVLLAEKRAPATEATFEKLRDKFGEDDAGMVAAATEAAVAARKIALSSGGEGAWRPENEYDPATAIEVIMSRNALSAAGNDGLRASHLQQLVKTITGKAGFSTALGTFWKRLFDDPEAYPLEFWELFLQSILTALGEKCRPICVGSTLRRVLAAGAVRQWRPRLEEIFSSERQYGVAVAGGVEHVGLRAKTHHQTGHWLFGLDFSNAFNTVRRTNMLE